MAEIITRVFGPWDYVIMGIMLTISASIGVYYRFSGGRQKTTQEYLLGDGKMSVIPVAFSLMAGFVSASSLLGVSVEAYSFGTMFAAVNVGYFLATPCVAYIYLPVFFRLQNTSVYKYLEQRFGVTTRLIASIVFCIQLIMFMGIVLYAPALALEAVTGLDKTLSMLIIGTVCTFYSSIGGVKAVVIADLFQSILMFTAIYLVVIKGTIDAGGPAEVWRIAYEGGRIEFDSISADPTVRHTWWSLVIGGFMIHMGTYAVSQVQVQRLLTVKDLRASQQVCWLSWPIQSILNLSVMFSGLVIYARYYQCDPVITGRINSFDQLQPLFVMDAIGYIPCLAGLYTAGIFSGSLSTVSSAVNSLAAITLEDYLKPLYKVIKKKPIPNTHLGLIVKLMALGFGFISIAMAFLAEVMGGVLQASFTIFGIAGGPVVAVFTLGMFTTFVNEKGTVPGLIIGIGLMIWIGFGGPRPPAKLLSLSSECPVVNATMTGFEFMSLRSEAPVALAAEPEEYLYVYRLSYMWFGILGFLITMIVAIVISLIYNKVSSTPMEEVHVDFLTPMVRSYVIKRRARESKRAAKTEMYDNHKNENIYVVDSTPVGEKNDAFVPSESDPATMNDEYSTTYPVHIPRITSLHNLDKI